MNNKKKYLIILSIIFTLASIAYNIYSIVLWFMTPSGNRRALFYLIFDFISIPSLIAVVVLLTMAIWGNGKYFRQRYGYYMTALVISIIMDTLSVGTILLIVTMFLSDWEWIKPDKDDKVIIDDKTEVITKSREEKIKELQEMKARGEISEEEFQRRLMDLL